MRDIQIIDIEASGLHFDSYPIEIAILSNEQPQSWLIKPQPTWTYWDSIAEDMHGISREVLRAEGLSCTTVAAQLSAAIRPKDGTVYSDAANWDRSWIQTLYRAAGCAAAFDVLPIQSLLTARQVEMFYLERQRLEKSGQYRLHRAAPDTLLIRAAYYRALGSWH